MACVNLDNPDWLGHMAVLEMGFISFLLNLPLVSTWSPLTLRLRTGTLRGEAGVGGIGTQVTQRECSGPQLGRDAQ